MRVELHTYVRKRAWQEGERKIRREARYIKSPDGISPVDTAEISTTIGKKTLN
jgi:hypothetical protein